MTEGTLRTAVACAAVIAAPALASINSVGYLFAAVAVLAALGLASLRGPLSVPRPAYPVLAAGAAWCAAMGIWAAAGPARHVSLLFWFKALAVYGAAVAVALDPEVRRNRRWLVSFAVAAGAVAALDGVFEVARGADVLPGWIDPDHHRLLRSRAASSFANPNLLATYLVLLLPPALALFLQARHIPWICASGAATLAIFTGIVLTFSRGGWLACAAGLLAATWWLRRALLQWRVAWLVPGVLLAVGLFGGAVMERTATLGSPAELGIRQRMILYEGELRAIAARPWTGGGLHGFQTIYPRYRVAGGYYPLDAHNDVLQVAMEMGVPAAGLYTLFLVMLVLAVRPRGPAPSTSPERAESVLQGGIAAGLLGFIAATMFMGSLRYLGLQVPFWLLAGAGLAGSAPPAAPAKNGLAGRLLFMSLLIAAVGYWALLWSTDPARLPASASLADRVRWLEGSSEWMPWRHETHFVRGQLLAAAGRFDEALEAFSRAERLDPAQPEYARWRALVLAGGDRVAEALQELERALERDPHSEEYLLLKGRLLERAGRLDEAAKVLERALATNPQYLSINREVFPGVFEALVRIERRLGNAEAASALEARARELYPVRREE